MEHRSIFVHAYRGFTDLPNYGKHPGVIIALVLIVVTTLSGFNRGIAGMIVGFVISCTVYIPIIIAGSISRSRSADRHEERRNKQIEEILRRDF